MRLPGPFLTVLLLSLIWSAVPLRAQVENAEELNRKAEEVLVRLVENEPAAAEMVENAKGVLVFPTILKGGLLVGGAGGDGVLRIDGEPAAYYRSTSLSYGLQAGLSTFAYVMLFMDRESLDFLLESSGWEVGVGPAVTVVDRGLAGKLSTTTARDGIYVFFLDQKGLFAGAGVEGTKITRLDAE